MPTAPQVIPINEAQAVLQGEAIIPLYLEVLEKRGYKANNQAERDELIRIGVMIKQADLAAPSQPASRFSAALQSLEKAAGVTPTTGAGYGGFDDMSIKSAAATLLSDENVRTAARSCLIAQLAASVQAQQAG
jgi:hypothetical protein